MRTVLFCAVVLSGCGVFRTIKDVGDKIDDVTDPRVTQALILGVAEPEEPELRAALQLAAYETGTGVTAFLADSITGADPAPLEGARVTLHGSQTLRFVEDGDGAYSVAPDLGLTYTEGQVWDIQVDAKGPTATIEVELPPPADLEVPASFPSLSDMTLDLTGQGYQSVLVVVIDALGQVTYSNEPADMSEALDFAGKGEDLETFTIPAEAFPDDTVYAVGIAALRGSDAGDVTNQNTLLSGLQAGQMEWHPLSTIPI